MSAILVSPTEPPYLKELGTSSSAPEKQGCDFMWYSKPLGMVGVQRKELSDFIASMNDGRLSKEINQMEGLALKVLVLEGRGKWTTDGQLLDNWSRCTKRQLRGFLWTIRSRGVWVDQTDNLNETRETLLWLQDWTQKEKHYALASRGAVRKNGWGQASQRDYAVHLLTSLPSVGPKTAEAILDHFGKVPFELDATKEELMEVSGVGKVTAERIMKVFGGTDADTKAK